MKNLDLLLEGVTGIDSNEVEYDLFSESATMIAVADYEYDIFQEAASADEDDKEDKKKGGTGKFKNLGGDILAWIKKMFTKIREIMMRIINDITQGNIMLKQRMASAKKNNKMDVAVDKKISVKGNEHFLSIMNTEPDLASVRAAVKKVNSGEGLKGSSKRDQYVMQWMNDKASVKMDPVKGGIMVQIGRVKGEKEKSALTLKEAQDIVAWGEDALKVLAGMKKAVKDVKTEQSEMEKSAKGADGANQKYIRDTSIGFAAALPGITTIRRQVCVTLVNDALKVLHGYKKKEKKDKDKKEDDK